MESEGREITVDPTTGYLQVPGQEARFAHPVGGDICTSVTLRDDSVAAKTRSSQISAVRVDARLELAHRLLIQGGEDPDYDFADALAGLMQLALRREDDEVPAPGAYALADRAREAILSDERESADLIRLARLLKTSPSHLSRTFQHHSGMSISRYRNRVRVSRAMQYLEEGASDLANLAITLGFNDQAHFTRTMRRELSSTPGILRTHLSH